MKLSISNIAWKSDFDNEIYLYLKNKGFQGIEIAPSRIVGEQPYSKIPEAKRYANYLKERFGLETCSMQSIWYGKKEKLFGTEEERKILLEYTKKAIEFAEAINCKNLVFGCPANRYLPEGTDEKIAYDFFEELGNYAKTHHVIIAIEANPVLYHTNYINTTKEAFDFVKNLKNEGILVNIDFGTILYNQENLKWISSEISFIHHIHISEPELKTIKKRECHKELAEILKKADYKNYISIEMKDSNEIEIVKDTIDYIQEVFL